MRTEANSFEKLIEEFSNIRVEIEIIPRSHSISESSEANEDGFIEVDGNVEYKLVYEFYVKFKNEKKVYFFKNNDFYSEYLKRLDKLRLDFYKEIMYEISTSNNKFHLHNLLSEYKIRFSEFFDNYYDHKVDLPGGIVNLKGNKIIKYNYSDDKPIFDDYKERILDKYLNIQFETIEKIIKYLDEKIDLIKFQTLEEKHVSTPHSEKKSLSKRILDTKSFSLNPKLFNSDPQKADAILAEKLKNFHETLFKYGFIRKIDYRYFLHAFTNNKIVKQIEWEGDAKDLYYLIKTLYDQDIIVPFKNYWEVACKCFIAYHKRSKLCTPETLSRCHAPTLGERLRKLNSAIDTLK